MRALLLLGLLLWPCITHAQSLAPDPLAPWAEGLQGETRLHTASLQAGTLHQQRQALSLRLLWRPVLDLQVLDFTLFVGSGLESEALWLDGAGALALGRQRGAWSGITVGGTWRPLAHLSSGGVNWAVLLSGRQSWESARGLGRGDLSQGSAEWRMWRRRGWLVGGGMVWQRRAVEAITGWVWGRRCAPTRSHGIHACAELLGGRAALWDDAPWWRAGAGLVLMDEAHNALGIAWDRSWTSEAVQAWWLRWRSSLW